MLGLFASLDGRGGFGLGFLAGFFGSLHLLPVLGDLLFRLAAGLLDGDIGVAGALDRFVERLLEFFGAAFGIQTERIGGGAHQDLLADCKVFPDLQLDIDIVCHCLPRD